MADKTPLRLVLDGSNNPTGIAEFQSGETIGNSFLTNSGITLADDSSSTTIISLGETLKLSGDTGITTTISGDTVNIDLDDTAVTPNTYGSSTAIPVITIDQQGRITGASTQNISTTLTISDDTSTLANIDLGTDTLKIAGDTGITTSVSGDTINIDLDDTAVTPNTYGSSTAIPVITIDQQGRITGASTQNISTTLTISDDTSTLANINLGSDTLKISGTANEIETSISGDTITIGLPNDVTIAGNLTVNGTTTTVNSTTIEITNSFTFEGATANDFETTLGVIDPTADRTINLPNVSGTIITTGNISDITGLSNSQLSNPSFTIVDDSSTTSTISLGESLLLAGGTGITSVISGDSITFNIDSTVATLTGTQTLTNKTLTSPKINEDVVVTATATELNFTDGVTSNIQTQLDAKASRAFAIAQAVALG